MDPTPFARAPARVAVTYMAVAGAWILLSDALVLWAFPASSQWSNAQTVKGLLFVLVTGLLVRALVASYGRLVEARTAEVLAARDALARTEARATAGLLAASIGHDLNNLLTVLRLDLDDEPTDDSLASARAAVDEIATMARRLQAQGAARPPAAEPLGDEVARQLRILRGHPRLRGRHMTTRIDPTSVRVDPPLLASVVWNLVLNAGDAGMHVQVATTGAALIVEDDGPGFDDAPTDPFHAMATTRADGHGLGLISVRACAQALGATVAVDRSPGLGGARVTVTFPSSPPG